MGAQLQGYVFGCDICNDVCPWNQRFAEPTQISEFRSASKRVQRHPDFFENMTEAEFSQMFGSSPLERAGLEGMRRNYRAVFAGAQAGAQSG
jgi:epoxyqueuosine reductase